MKKPPRQLLPKASRRVDAAEKAKTRAQAASTEFVPRFGRGFFWFQKESSRKPAFWMSQIWSPSRVTGVGNSWSGGWLTCCSELAVLGNQGAPKPGPREWISAVLSVSRKTKGQNEHRKSGVPQKKHPTSGSFFSVKTNNTRAVPGNSPGQRSSCDERRGHLCRGRGWRTGWLVACFCFLLEPCVGWL